jgi:hypothetical protein
MIVQIAFNHTLAYQTHHSEKESRYNISLYIGIATFTKRGNM